MKLIFPLTIVTLLGLPHLAHSQQRKLYDTLPDSATIVQTKNALNNLPADAFLKATFNHKNGFLPTIAEMIVNRDTQPKTP